MTPTEKINMLRNALENIIVWSVQKQVTQLAQEALATTAEGNAPDGAVFKSYGPVDLDKASDVLRFSNEQVTSELSAALAAQGDAVPVAGTLPFAILDDEMKALRRFDECVRDGQGYDVAKDMMKRLAEIGLVRRVTAAIYEHTNFGLSVLNGDFDHTPAPVAGEKVAVEILRAVAEAPTYHDDEMVSERCVFCCTATRNGHMDECVVLKAQAALDYPSPTPAPVTGEKVASSDDKAVDRFAAAMKAKMYQKWMEGRGGWDVEEACTMKDLATMLVEHVPKGDPVDIANFCMMLHQREAAAIEHHPCHGGEAKRAIVAAHTAAQVAAMKPGPVDVVVEGRRVVVGESIAANPDAMIILTQGYPAEAVARVVDAHTRRQVAASKPADKSVYLKDMEDTLDQIAKAVGCERDADRLIVAVKKLVENKPAAASGEAILWWNGERDPMSPFGVKMTPAKSDNCTIPLYTTPQPAAQVVAGGLTLNDLNKIDDKLSMAQRCLSHSMSDAFIEEARAIIATMKGEPQ